MHFSVPIIGGLKPGIRHPVVPVVLKGRFDFGKIDSRNKLNRLGEIFFPELTKP